MMAKDYFSQFPYAKLSSQDGQSRIEFCSYRYEFPEIKSGCDADWQRAYFYLTIPGFKAEIDEPMFEGSLLNVFLTELKKLATLKTNMVEFRPTEPYVNFSLTLNSMKKVNVKGIVTNLNSECYAKLGFEFETDLTYIDIFINGLKEILEKFPPRK